MPRWYLIHTKPAGEAAAQANLHRQGYEVYWPRALQAMRRCGRSQYRVIALFPRYLFLRLKEGWQSLAPVRSTAGVAAVVRFGADYAIVPDGIIDGLRQHADPSSGLHVLNSVPGLKSGDAVRVVGGTFDGLEGVFQREDGRERVIVLLKLLGQDVAVRLPATCVLSTAAC